MPVVNCDTGLVQVPSTGTTCHQLEDMEMKGGLNEPNYKSSRVFNKLIGLAIGLKVDLVMESVVKVELAIEEVL